MHLNTNVLWLRACALWHPTSWFPSAHNVKELQGNPLGCMTWVSNFVACCDLTSDPTQLCDPMCFLPVSGIAQPIFCTQNREGGNNQATQFCGMFSFTSSFHPSWCHSSPGWWLQNTSGLGEITYSGLALGTEGLTGKHCPLPSKLSLLPTIYNTILRLLETCSTQQSSYDTFIASHLNFYQTS